MYKDSIYNFKAYSFFYETLCFLFFLRLFKMGVNVKNDKKVGRNEKTLYLCSRK